MKTATDLLKEILANQISLDKKADTTNFLLTTLISRFDQLAAGSQIEKKTVIKKPPTIVQGTANIAPPTNILEAPAPPHTVTNKPVTASSLSEDKFAIVQQIKRNNVGVWLCNIAITNSSNQVVFEGKSARNGQWATVLPAGNYTVVITRGAGQEASEINITDNFTVSAAKVKNGKITLNEIKL